MIYHGDCLEILKTLPDNSVDSICTDPPYGLSFMGKKWDYDVPSIEIWQECLRVLKPGGHLLSFAGTRTQHRMAVRIEDAGFEIRDMIAWVYSTGFPKSLNVFKQLKKNCTCGSMEAYEQGTKTLSKPPVRPLQESDLSEAVNPQEKQGEVLQSSVSEQSTHDERKEAVAVFQFPDGRKESSLEGRPDLQETQGELQGSDLSKVSDRVSGDGQERRLHNATSSSNGTTPREVVGESGSSAPHRPQSEQQQYREPCAFCKQYGTQATRSLGIGTALKPSHEPITVARKPLIGTVAENILTHGTGGLNIDGSRVGTESTIRPAKGGGFEGGWKSMEESGSQTGRWPANLIHDGSEEVVECFPYTKSNLHAQPKGSWGGGFTGDSDKKGEYKGYDTGGSAARFFYCAKASKKDRDEGLEGFEEKYGNRQNGFSDKLSDSKVPRANNHPTVKPTALMRYLVKLVTPPGGTVLDPFTGSGSTGKACKLEGFEFIGIEREADYVKIAEARIKAVNQQPALV